MTGTLWPIVGSAQLSTGDRVNIVRESVVIGAPSRETIEIEHPEDPPSLLQGWCNAADPTVPIPYWAEIWPAAKAIARRLSRGPSLADATVIDLGCGLGLSGVAAGLRGGRVTFVDNHPDALAFARRNASAAGITGTAFRQADWRDPSWACAVDLVLGADVIYERSEHEPIVEILERLLGDGGRAWLGDPCREIADGFLSQWTRSHAASTIKLDPFPGEDVASAIHELRL